MKKNIMLRLSAVLLVAVLLTTCVISGTWAKYVTTGSAEDSARVAKWGVTVEAETPNNNEYQNSELTTKDSGIIVNSYLKTIAPGSYVKFASVDISGTPEVAVQVTYQATLTLDGWTVTYDHDDDDSTPEVEYMPLVFYVNGTPISADTSAGLKAAVETAINAYSKKYAAGTNLAEQATEELTVTCYWAFAGNDAADTALGDLLTAPTVSLSITATVTQLDEYTPAP